jgi:hypothetical protein
MAKLVDPDDLNRNTEIRFNTGSNASGSKTIDLFLAGNLTYDGVTGQCVYSKCKELWRTATDLIRFPFPIISITEKKFDIVNRWSWQTGSTAGTTQTLLRDCGWAVKDPVNASYEEFMGFITLGTLASDDQVYYQQSASISASNNVFTGSVNNAVKIYGDANYGNFDYRDYFKCYVRTYLRTYDQSQLSAIGETAVTYQVYAFPLTNGSDPKITHDDPTVSTGSAYNGITVWYLTASVSKTIGSFTYQYDTIINASGSTKEQVYEKIQYMLRQEFNINSASLGTGSVGLVNGKTADELLNFVGDTLQTAQGVFVENIADTDINFYQFQDTSSTYRSYPYVAAGTITFNDNLQNDLSGSYWMFFTTLPSITGSYGSASAIIVLDNSENPITGSTYAVPSRTFTFDYDGNVQGGRTPATDATVTLVALGLSTAQYVSTAGTIGRTNANAFSLVAALERNYSNP